MSHDPNNDRGGFVISDEVLAAIAVTAAQGVEGVSAIVPRASGMTQLLKKELRLAKITGGEAEVTVELLLRLRADTKLITVAGRVQRAVKEALQSMTDRAVARVNLKIMGVDERHKN